MYTTPDEYYPPFHVHDPICPPANYPSKDFNLNPIVNFDFNKSRMEVLCLAYETLSKYPKANKVELGKIRDEMMKLIGLQ